MNVVAINPPKPNTRGERFHLFKDNFTCEYNFTSGKINDIGAALVVTHKAASYDGGSFIKVATNHFRSTLLLFDF